MLSIYPKQTSGAEPYQIDELRQAVRYRGDLVRKRVSSQDLPPSNDSKKTPRKTNYKEPSTRRMLESSTESRRPFGNDSLVIRPNPVDIAFKPKVTAWSSRYPS